MALDPSSAAATPKLSAYATSLDPTAKTRYLEKIAIVSHYDPMLGVPRGSKIVTPLVESFDVLSYLVVETSFCTGKEFKARKGLDAFNQFVSGWVKEVKSFEHSGKHVTVSRVSWLPDAMCHREYFSIL